MRLAMTSVHICACLRSMAAAAQHSPGMIVEPQNLAGASNDMQRYLLLGTWYGGATKAFVDTGVAAGFNSVRVTADWGQMEKVPGMIDWSLLDNQTAYVHDRCKLPLVFNIWCRRSGPDEVVPLAGLAVDQFGNGSTNHGSTWSISFGNEKAVSSALAFARAVVERYSAKYPSTLMYYVCFDGYSETEYFPGEPDGGYFDYGYDVRSRLTAYLTSKYQNVTALNAAWGAKYTALDQARPPTDNQPDGQKYIDWYLFREMLLGSVIKRVSEMVHSVSPVLKVAVQWGSVYDAAIRLRGVINFPCLAQGIDVVWVDDAPSYPSCFAMDYLRSNLSPSTWLANEIDGPSVGTDEQYYAEAANSFQHGCSVLSVANWDTSNLAKRSKTLFQRIASQFLGKRPTSKVAAHSMTVRSTVLFHDGSATETYVPAYTALSKSGADWVDIKLINDLGRQPACDHIDRSSRAGVADIAMKAASRKGTENGIGNIEDP